MNISLKQSDGSAPVEAEGRNITLSSDVAADDSDKIITVPTGKEWDIYWIKVILVSTSVVGDRRVQLSIKTAADVVLHYVNSGIDQVASLTRNYLFGAGAIRETSFGGDGTELILPLPPKLLLPAGYKIHILDTGAIDAAADDMTIHILADERTLGSVT